MSLLCTSLGYSQEPTQMKRLITSLDEVMNKMPHLVKLNPLVDSTETGKNYQKAIILLKTSHRSMMNWMQGFGERFTGDEMMKENTLPNKKKTWLNEEEKKINTL